MTELSTARRDALMRLFNKAMFARDMQALYQAVTEDFVWRVAIGPAAPVARELGGPDAIAAYLDERTRTYENLRFNDVVTYHAPTCSFVSFRLTGHRRADASAVDVLGLERFAFRDDRIALKDAYWKHIGIE
jgi:ketosteroid isomerase-like protein